MTLKLRSQCSATYGVGVTILQDCQPLAFASRTVSSAEWKLWTNWEMHDCCFRMSAFSSVAGQKRQNYGWIRSQAIFKNPIDSAHADFKGCYYDCCTSTLMPITRKEVRCSWQIASLDPWLPKRENRRIWMNVKCMYATNMKFREPDWTPLMLWSCHLRG